MIEKIKRKNRNIYLIRDVLGRFLKVSSKKERLIIKAKKTKKDKRKILYNANIEKKRSSFLKQNKRKAGNLKAKNIKEKVKLTNFYEYKTYHPVKGKRGQLAIHFEFLKFYTNRIERERAWGTSKKATFPKDYEKAFNKCLRGAISQIHFTPDDFVVLEHHYIYYVSI